MPVTIDLYAVLLGILIVLAIVFVGYLIVLIRRLMLVLHDSHMILQDNRAHIDETLQNLPGISRNIEKITSDVDESLTMATQLAQNVDAKFKSESSNLYDKTETAIEAIQMVGQLIKGALNYFDRKKPRR